NRRPHRDRSHWNQCQRHYYIIDRIQKKGEKLSRTLMTKVRPSSKTRQPRQIRHARTDDTTQCPLCKIPGNEKLERTFKLAISTSGKGHTRDFYIVSTKTKKGHQHRYMIVLREHVRQIEAEAESEAIAKFFGFMKKLGVDYAIMESTHATIGDHWH